MGVCNVHSMYFPDNVLDIDSAVNDAKSLLASLDQVEGM